MGWAFGLFSRLEPAKDLLLGLVQSNVHVNRDEILSSLGSEILDIVRYKMRCLHLIQGYYLCIWIQFGS
jgi:hypothetical protein